MLPRIETVNQRIRESELFPRIRDAEAILKADEQQKFRDRVRLAPAARQKTTTSFKEDFNEGNDYFSSHVLNSDSSSAKYMLYNEVVYPKMFQKWNTSVQSSEALERMWVSGFLDQVNRDEMNRFQSKLADHEAELAKGKFKIKEPKKIDNSVKRRGLSDEDEMKLLAFEESLKKRPKMKRIKGGIKAYQEANEAIINSKKPKKPVQSMFHSDALDTIFNQEHVENKAASVIQHNWRRISVIRKLKNVVIGMQNAVKIQRFVRGMIARKWVAKWFAVRNQIVIHWQCHIRKWHSNKHLRPKIAAQIAAVIKIQSIIRMHQGWNRYIYKLKMIAATHIQALWRGAVARVLADKRWVNKVVVPIQKFFRKYLARKDYFLEKSERGAAALVIQKKFRCWYANKVLGRSLFARETRYRRLQMEILAAEEEYNEEMMTKLRDNLKKRGVKQILNNTITDLHTAFTDIHILESELIESTRQRQQLSPRALQQGWLQEIDKTIINLRSQITETKLNCIFKKQLAVLHIEEAVDRKINEIESFAHRRRAVADAREQVSPVSCRITASTKYIFFAFL